MFTGARAMAFTKSYSRHVEAHLAAAAAAARAMSHHLAEVDRFRTLLGLRPASAAAADRAEEEKAEEEESEEEEAEESEENEFFGFGRGVKRRRHEVTDLATRVLKALRKPNAKMGLSISTLAELCAQEVPLIQEAVDMLVHDGDAEPTDIQGDPDDETVFAV